MKLDPKGLEAAREQPGTNHDGIIRAYLTALTAGEQEPVAWPPTATVKWLEEYDGPACGTQTVAHNRPIKSDGGVAVYLAPPTAQLEALRNDIESYVEANAALTTENTRLKARVAELEKALDLFEHYGCPICHGDCASANPPVDSCPMQAARRVREGGGDA